MTADFIASNARMNGQPGMGFYRLFFTFDLNFRLASSPEVAFLEFPAGELFLRGPGDSRSLVGALSPKSGSILLYAVGMSLHNGIEYHLDLDRHRLKAIEDFRRGGDLSFYATFHPRLILAHGSLLQSPCQVPLQVNQSDWTRIREGMGAGRTLLYEIREPSSDIVRGMPAAVQHWQNAWHEMLRGGDVGYRQAAAECRPVLVGISRGIGEGNDRTASAELQQILTPLRAVGTQLSKAERLRLLRRVLTLLCGLAHHPEEIALPTTWDLPDAELVVGACAALLQLYGRPAR